MDFLQLPAIYTQLAVFLIGQIDTLIWHIHTIHREAHAYRQVKYVCPLVHCVFTSKLANS